MQVYSTDIDSERETMSERKLLCSPSKCEAPSSCAFVTTFAALRVAGVPSRPNIEHLPIAERLVAAKETPVAPRWLVAATKDLQPIGLA